MNENIPSSLESASQPKTSALAIWSLVLGILSLACFTIFAAIPGVICGHKALSKIKRSSGALTGQGLAIAGLVTGYIGIAWAIFVIPMMLAIAIPNFVKARDTAMQNACINNLRQIDAAKKEWALEKGKADGDVPTIADLTPYFKDGKFPTCPSGGTYTIGAVTNPPTCTIPGHKLPDY
jgi:competence protein ComGC